jgi:hypothetical protein
MKPDNKYREVISIGYFENKNIKEIADSPVKKEKTFKSLYSHGKFKIKNLYYKY